MVMAAVVVVLPWSFALWFQLQKGLSRRNTLPSLKEVVVEMILLQERAAAGWVGMKGDLMLKLHRSLKVVC